MSISMSNCSICLNEITANAVKCPSNAHHFCAEECFTSIVKTLSEMSREALDKNGGRLVCPIDVQCGAFDDKTVMMSGGDVCWKLYKEAFIRHESMLSEDVIKERVAKEL